MAREHELKITIDAILGSSYQATFREAQAAMGSFREEYNALANTAKDITAYERQAQAVENTKAKLELLQQQYANIQREINETGGFSSDLENKLASKQAQIDKTSDALQKQTEKLEQYESALQQAGVNTDDLRGESARLAQEMDNLRKGLDDAQNGAEQLGASGLDALMDMQGVLVGAGLVKLVDELAEHLKECAAASMEFEAGMAGVRRTVGGSEEEIAAMGDEFQNMAGIMPITTSELAEIATTAGQLGIAKENVRDFTQVMAELATTTDLSADEAATLLAQFSNITSTTDYDRLGSTVAALGDATATTASKVVQMSQGIAAAASVAGMSAQDVLGISAAVGALGVRSQMGATAMSQLITKLYLAIETGEELEGYAQTANMTAQEFKRAWGEDAAGALNAFIQGLNDTERNGKSAIAMLNELGITNARQLRVFTGLAQSGDMLTRTIALANQSWSENTALSEKAGIMYDTTRAKMATMQNEVNNLRIAVGDQFSPAIGRGMELLGGLAGGLADFVDEHPIVVKALGSMTVGLATVTAGLGAAKAAMGLFSLVAGGIANPVGLAVAGVSALAIGLGVMAATAEDSYDALTEVRNATAELADVMQDTQAAVDETTRSSEAAAMTAGYYIDRLKEMEQAGTVAHGGQAKYKAILDEINRLLPGVNAQIDAQTGLVMGGTDALMAQAEAWKRNTIQQAMYEANSERLKAWAEAQIAVAEARDRLTIAEEEGNRIADEIAEKEQLLSYLMEGRKKLTLENMGGIENLTAAQNRHDEQILQLEADIQNLTNRQETNRGEQDALNLAVQEGEATVARYENEISTVTGGVLDFADSNEEAGESLETMIQPLTDVLSKLDELAASYEKTYNAALESIQGQFDIFEQAPEVVITGTDDIISALESQTDYWESYSDNLADLNSRNIAGLDLMVKALADGTTKGAETIASLAQAGDSELETIVGKWLELQSAQEETTKDLPSVKEEYIKLLGDINTEMSGAVDKMDLSGDARNAALSTIDAYINAVQGKVSAVYRAYAAIAAAGRAALSNGSGGVVENDRGYSTTTYYGHAGGTDNAPEGWRWVGEQGPELMYFQGGETVIPHTKSVEMLRDSGGGQQIINVTLAPSYQISGANDPQDIRAILEEHDRELPGKVTAILREAQRDAVRRSYV